MEDKAECIIIDDAKDLIFNFKSLLLNDENEQLKPFISEFSNEAGFKKHLINRNFDDSKRPVLRDALLKQYSGTEDEIEKKQINRLSDKHVYTVTTGHQLSFAAGPLFVLIKAAHTIKLSRELENIGINCVPVFWMADEDHDFDEINHINFNGVKIGAKNNSQNKLICGAFDSEIWKEALSEIRNLWQPINTQILDKLNEVYSGERLNVQSFRDFLRYIFKGSGLIFIYGNDKNLKSLSASLFKREIEESFIKKSVENQLEKLAKTFHKHEKDFNQAEAKDVNGFYLRNNQRLKITKTENEISIDNEKISVSNFANEIYQYSERLSPGVLLRPLYQENILPNLAYIGGPGEMAYWLQLKAAFSVADIPFPVLVQRNNFFPINNKTLTKFCSLGFEVKDVLKKYEKLYEEFKNKNIEQLSLDEQKNNIALIFENLSKTVELTDTSLSSTLGASKTKAIKALEKLEEKLNRAIRKRYNTQINSINNINKDVFPNGEPNERINSGLQYLNVYGTAFADFLINHSNPYGFSVKIISLK